MKDKTVQCTTCNMDKTYIPRPEPVMPQVRYSLHVDCFNWDQELSSNAHHPVSRRPIIILASATQLCL